MQKVILITGASSGIGYDTALYMRGLGWRVFAAVRTEADRLRLQQEGLESLILDVDDSLSIQAAFAQILEQGGGRLDGIFCNAGFGQMGAVEDISRQALREQFETNVFGTWECVARAMKVFRKQGHGRILVNSSILGFAAMPMRGAYNSSKFALEGMCDTLRHEVRGSGISVSLVEPGPVTSRFNVNALAKFQQNVDIESSFHRETYQAHLRRLSGQNRPTPYTVSAAACAAVCARAFTDAVPKARYRVTVPTKVFWYLRKFLPTAALDYCKRRAFAAERGNTPS